MNEVEALPAFGGAGRGGAEDDVTIGGPPACTLEFAFMVSLRPGFRSGKSIFDRYIEIFGADHDDGFAGALLDEDGRESTDLSAVCKRE